MENPLGHGEKNYLKIYWKNKYCFYQSDMWSPVMPSLSQITISCGVVWCGVVWCGVVWCGVV
jgi:hypothetical protein